MLIDGLQRVDRVEIHAGMIWSMLYVLYFAVLRPSLKWLLHVVSGQSELERILLKKTLGIAEKVKAVEYSMLNSRSESLRTLASSIPLETLDTAVSLVIRLKYVDAKQSRNFKPKLTFALGRIVGYHHLFREIEWLRKTPFDPENPEHVKLLNELWALLKPDVEQRRWQDIGFQGNDPATDFRGMGILGLIQLVYFCRFEREHARRIFSRSLHPKIGYPFAVAGINFTSTTRELLHHGCLRTHFYNSPTLPSLESFHRLYCALFVLFDDLWFQEEPENVMAFNGIKNRIYGQLVEHLTQNPSATFPGIHNLKNQVPPENHVTDVF